MTKRKIQQEQYALLREVLQKRAPDTISLLGKLGSESLSAEERIQLQGIVGDELAASGVGGNGDINDYGKKLDELISVIGKLSEDWG